MILIDTDRTTFLKYPESERGRRLTGPLLAIPVRKRIRMTVIANHPASDQGHG
jgi:hypothetical protein